MSLNQRPEKGISLRAINICLIIGAVLLSGLIFFFTFRLSFVFHRVTEAAEEQIDLRKAALELMDASDYLTENVQRFTVQGDMRFLEAYFDEALETRRREDAVSRMSDENVSTDALKMFQDAMDASVKLMDREYYAMRLVVEANGYTQYPQAIRDVTLSEEDRALNAEEKLRRAVEMVFDENYYAQKNQIQKNMRESLAIMEQTASARDASELRAMHKELVFVRIIIALQAIGTIVIVCMTSTLGIRPILKAVDRIKDNSRIPEVGANEFRYLARTYNKMYEVYKKSLDRLNFKASHDELTGVYNRVGYELLLSGIDLSSTYMILFDIDNFKSINDTYGHETGDRVLQKMVRVLKNNFRSDDYICRVGGDEFVVFLTHTAEFKNKLIAAKIEKINQELDDTSDGLPVTSLSVGIAHGADAAEAKDLFVATDKAMYHSKKKGKRTYTFYSPQENTTEKTSHETSSIS